MRQLTSLMALVHPRAAYSTATIFDVPLKAVQRSRSAYMNPGQKDALRDEVARRVVERVEDCSRRFRHALILGGTGIQVMREMLRSGSRAGTELQRVVMVDHSEELLALGREAAKAVPCSARFEFHRMDPESKDEEIGYDATRADSSEQFDLVISSLGLHWVNDIPGVMTRCRQLMAPDGFFIGAMLGGDTLQEMRISCTLAQQEREGGVSPRTSPFVHVRDAGNLLTRAGFQIPSVDVDDIVVKYEDPVALVDHLRSMAENSALVNRHSLSRDAALAAAAIYTELFGEAIEDGGSQEGSAGLERAIPATYQVIYMSGWSPSANQTQPAKRGSATVSFKDLEDHVGSA
jgi:NADH dehydrogenase [ubiquinone] 1 alpha subcomplex assembly factor 5